NYKEGELTDLDKSNIAASFQKAAVQAITQKVIIALNEHKVKSLSLVGGVAANQKLRDGFLELGKSNNLKVVMPKIEYCGDNAVMIAYRGMQYHKDGKKFSLSSNAYPSLPFDVFGEAK
ncbi:MAG: tRNA (adenosine(37)-N6)-threonylcarbamoyltransferase complex transferase subunit TsaD, partial [Arcobacter sp.]|nr:tRNA (adenosine(37)-N6)-threonylcarbamoyltransferase complex transferase subunit TsaD [Arcobacter sp.]